MPPQTEPVNVEAEGDFRNVRYAESSASVIESYTKSNHIASPADSASCFDLWSESAGCRGIPTPTALIDSISSWRIVVAALSCIIGAERRMREAPSGPVAPASASAIFLPVGEPYH